MRTANFQFFIISFFILSSLSACNSITTKNAYDTEQVNLLLEQQQKADAAYNAEDWATAIKHYEILVKNYPSNDIVWFRLGNCYSQLGDNEKSLSAYSKAIELEPKNTKAWHNKGILQLRMATDTFIRMQEHAHEQDPFAIRGQYVVESIQDILPKAFGVTVDND